MFKKRFVSLPLLDPISKIIGLDLNILGKSRISKVLRLAILEYRMLENNTLETK
jgi:hypothetical protein|tara:strand:+ start:11331 stop:11492 length:162 start_codon:yes stop_codon:yes gene_type:complete